MVNVIVTDSGTFLLRREIEVLESLYQVELIPVSEIFTFFMLLLSVFDSLNVVDLLSPATTDKLDIKSFIRKLPVGSPSPVSPPDGPDGVGEATVTDPSLCPV